jgi:hypothetical protein
VRTYLYVCEGRVDNANVAGDVVDSHEPTAATKKNFGLHATRGAKLAAAHTKVPGGTPLCREYCALRRLRR